MIKILSHEEDEAKNLARCQEGLGIYTDNKNIQNFFISANQKKKPQTLAKAVKPSERLLGGQVIHRFL